VIERHVTFHLHPGKAQEFESSSARNTARQWPSTGLRRRELLSPQEVPDTLVLLLRFKDAEAPRPGARAPNIGDSRQR